MNVDDDPAASDGEPAGPLALSLVDADVPAADMPVEVLRLRRQARRQLAELRATLAQLSEVQEAILRHQQRLARPLARV